MNKTIDEKNNTIKEKEELINITNSSEIEDYSFSSEDTTIATIESVPLK